MELKGFERKYLRGLAHSMKPVVIVGQKGLTDGLIASVDEALDLHELIKVKFGDYKEKALKTEISEAIEKGAKCEMVGMIGHMAIFYRRQEDPEKRQITLPKK
ncbi:RNA-binding protein [Desulfatibacillum alkenivorans DSM 16219]|uniref:RNA-binding protein n=1 Tax=Desulfatibacillum alkenivorans DSM 16219 TaxID=1121393 RepID=A0A1M6YC69_9BACT|nr:ribosome assembly RNA-binding protein YhbY [Desulfatibacillum alkenivorans]SHL15881.1 RNA-binding protein [Desulfatibacillum alkenivorans DSM 16219]